MTSRAALLEIPRTPFITQTRPSPALPPIELPSVSELLVAGGDRRLTLDPATRRNKYGCAPLPDPTTHSFASSTASTISQPAYHAAARLHHRLSEALTHSAPHLVYARELGRMRRDIVDLCDLATLSGLDIVFAASGTDLHLLAAQLVGDAGFAPLLTIMMDPAETGSGVPTALLGCHLSAETPLGEFVTEGAAIAGAGLVELSAITSREADGTPRSARAIESEIEGLAQTAAAGGGKALLTLVDVSKTGMILPSLGFAIDLKRRFGEHIEILIDACQFRLAPSTLRAYLKHGFMVALTGSKFLTGPAFAGALLVPQAIARRLRRLPLAAGLGAYSPRADWPVGWNAAASLPSTANFGLLLRWEAALAELRAMHALDEGAIADFLNAFAGRIVARLHSDPGFAPLAVPQIDRTDLVRHAGWDQIQTIFPFILMHPTENGPEPMDRAGTQAVYHALAQPRTGTQEDERYQLGQPVPCGSRNGVAVSALRLCASARLVVEACAPEGLGRRAVLDRAVAALDKTARLAAGSLR